MNDSTKTPNAIIVDKGRAKEELAEVIRSLIETMENIPYAESFDIGDWVDGYRESNECGYAACVLGHHILRLGNYEQNLREEAGSLADIASSYSDDLDSLCIAALGESSLICSVYLGFAGIRRVSAAKSGYFTSEEILSSAHLNKEHPTPEDAIKHMKICLWKLENMEIPTKAN